MNPTRKKIHGQIFLWCCLAFALFLPIYGKLVPVFILLLVLNWLIEGRFMKIPLIFREKPRLHVFSFAAFYLIYIVGMFYSANTGFGFFDLEVKLALFVFPLVFATLEKEDVNPKMFSAIFFAFIAGCFISSLILFFIAIKDYVRDGDPVVFYYTHFSRFIHTSYLSMYFNLAIAFIGYTLIRKDLEFSPGKRIFLLFLFFLFSLEVFLLSSKAGIFSLVIVIILVVVYFMMVHRKIGQGFLILLLAGMVFYACFRFLPVTSGRFQSTEKVLSQKEGTDNDKMEGNNERMVVWKAAVKVILKNPVLGVGTGDVKDELMAEYQRENKQVALSMHLNSHDQYLQTWIATGLAGFLILVLMLVLPAWQALRKRDFLYFTFLIVFAFNMLVESMLEVQAGVVYYAFFNALLFYQMIGQPLSNKIAKT
ncbi:MAG: O-antigen ligase family protein [Bacteroidetes bacterium]|nr:O-antigen ligase family protein [Bacteroidota bacterium]